MFKSPISQWKWATLLAISVVLLYGAHTGQPWKQDPSTWSAKDIEQVLNDSPWAQSTPATFALAEDNGPPPPLDINTIPQGGMPNPHLATTDGKWDGGVGRARNDGPPILNVTVRWDSSQPVRDAQQRENAASKIPAGEFATHYVISLLGLVPGGRYDQAQLNTRSNADPDPRNPEQMLENVMRYTRLYVPGKVSLTPDDAKLDSATGTLTLFFKRNDSITAKEKEMFLETCFGSLSVVKRYRLKDMLYQGKLAL